MAGEPRIVQEKMTREEIAQLSKDTFGDMIKVVVDVEREVLAVGGMLHADAEKLLVADDSQKGDIWGANYFPERPAGYRIEYSAMINIRPKDNRSQKIQSETIRGRVRDTIERLVGPA